MGLNRRKMIIGALSVAAAEIALFGTANAHLATAGATGDRNIPGEPFSVRLVSRSEIEPQYWKQLVFIESSEPAGTIVVDTSQKFLFLILGGGRALRYGIGVGRQGFSWSGRATIKLKRKWPTWTPPKAMIQRDPRAAKYADGMPGGPDNPLGARALYLFQGHRDTLYRLHGTGDVSSIGHAVSSGCIRLLNQDIIDLYNRVPVGTEVVVLPAGQLVMSSPTPQTMQERAQWRARSEHSRINGPGTTNTDGSKNDFASFLEHLFR